MEIRVKGVKCNRTKFTICKNNFARDCNACHHIESPMVNTIFTEFDLDYKKHLLLFLREVQSQKFSPQNK